MSEQPTSKKWVDYTDQESSDEEHHEAKQGDVPKKDHPPQPVVQIEKKALYQPTKSEVNAELDKLDDLDYDRVDEVWLLMSSSDDQYLQKEMGYLKGKAKKGGNIISVYPSKVQDCYDVKVYIKIAYDYIQNGYDSSNLMKIIVSERNFEKQSQGRDNRRNKQSDFKDKSNEGEKKKYVDKETGLEPEPKIKKELSAAENDRRYSKQEAEKKGEELGNFRSKPTKKETEQVKPAEEAKSEKVEVPEVSKEVKQEVEQKPKQAKKEKAEKKQKKTKIAVPKYKSQNRFEGIEDLS